MYMEGSAEPSNKDLEDKMLSEMIHTKKDKSCVVSLTSGILNKNKTKPNSQKQSKNVVARR